MSSDGPAIFPAGLHRQLLRVRVELCRGDLGVFLKIPLTAGEGLFDIAAEFEFQRIAPHHVSTTEIGFPFLKHRAEIQKNDVVFRNRQIRRVLIVGSQGVAPRSDDALVPIALNPVHLFSQSVNIFVDLAFLGPWMNEVSRFNLRKQSLSLGLSIQQSSRHGFLRVVHTVIDYCTRACKNLYFMYRDADGALAYSAG